MKDTPVTRRDWHPADVKAAVEKTDVTMTALALKHGLSESACRNSLRKPTPRADKAISDQIGVPLHKIWPSRYDKDGRRIRRRHVRDQNRRESTAAHRLSAEAR
ncbi:helix-turn-helix domain-containing protein [Caulobacter soli]|uniref:helix-turn-helix domain-containing protein n=1 Tax=Caulobacter soli TaxID=2708539 RepID=UPI003CCD71C3